MSDVIHCAGSWYISGQSNHMDGSPSPPNFREVALPSTLCGLQQAGGLLLQVFRWLPAKLQCDECRQVVAVRTAGPGCATTEQITAVEIGLTQLAADTRPWRDADEHGKPDGNNPHVWFPVTIRTPLEHGMSLVQDDSQCTCGVYKSAYDHDKIKSALCNLVRAEQEAFIAANPPRPRLRYDDLPLRDAAHYPLQPRTLPFGPRPDPMLTWPRSIELPPLLTQTYGDLTPPDDD